MRYFVFTLSLIGYLSINNVVAQDSTNVSDSLIKIPSNWKTSNIFGLNVTQSSFVNWAAGGRNNIAALGFINSNYNYSKERSKWNNEMRLALGGVQYFDEPRMQKTDDQVMLSTNYGFRIKEKWYYSVLGDFRTQFMDGYVFPNDSIPMSRFMAPGYSIFSLGIDYTSGSNFSILMSFATGKFTFVNDQRLADSGAFGVRPAETDALGNIVRKGQRNRAEVGAYIKILYKKELMKNVFLNSRLELFSNYLNNPQNIDVNAEAIFNFKINAWFSATLQFNLMYDDDIAIAVRDANNVSYTAPRTQFKQVMGIGIQYRIANFKEEVKK
jgi:hypothetical protein